MEESNITLNTIEAKVRKLLEDFSSGMTKEEYMNLYTLIYNFCCMQNLSARDPASSNKEGARIGGREVYLNVEAVLCNYLEKITKDLESVMRLELLEAYAKNWKKLLDVQKVLNHLNQYLNNNWIRRQREEGDFKIFSIKDLMMVRWRTIVFDKHKERLVSCSLELVEKHRNGESIAADHIKAFVESCSYISISDTTSKTAPTSILYEKEFEAPFLALTKEYYTKESKLYLDSHGLSEYMKKVESRLAEEESRVESYLMRFTRASLISSCEKVLIESQFSHVESDFPTFLFEERFDDLQRLYRLASRISDGLTNLRAMFEGHVLKVGGQALDQLINAPAAAVAEGEAGGEDQGNDDKAAPADEKQDAKSYVDTLIKTYTRFNDIIKKYFKEDSGFQASLDKAFREISNRNAVCASSTKSPELLAKYSDSILKKGNKDENLDIEESLNRLMLIFRYIEDKDVFQKFYTNSLAKRLVNSLSASEDAEASMISKLKEACGVDYTSKLSRMFTDVGVCREMNEQFKQHLLKSGSDLSVDFYAMVLISNSWPFHSSSVTFNIPPDLENCVEKFSRFYHTKHNGRKLNWLYHLSRGELKAYFGNGKPTVYHFQVSTYQMGILLQYNNRDSYSLSELLGLTGLPKENLLNFLTILCKAKVLKCTSTPNGSVSSKDDANYALNLDFKSKKLRMNLNVVVRSEQKAENVETQKTVEADRMMLIQAAIVRIMKTRKTLKHVQLVTEVIEQLNNRFKPRVPDIKKEIDKLIDKDYLARSPESRDILNYVA